ncbi:MAG: 3-dehydroquinate synthase [Planctomycetes bacterium]|nr:3-dehydroquinate synthase [Planctomycetota bacterium]
MSMDLGPSREPEKTAHFETLRRQECTIHVEPGCRERLIEDLAGVAGRRVVVLTDDRVRALHAEDLVARFAERGLEASMIVVDEGERSKSFARWLAILERMHDLGFGRRDLLVNVGGGLVCDLGGFCAASYMRGVSYVNVPTTLLAQHDAAIGGKVAVNAPWAKNFVGAFHQPQAVYCDATFLETLSRRDLAAGIAEALKVAIIADVDLFELIEREVFAILDDRAPEILRRVVRRCVSRKLELLEHDPFEMDLRRVLNFGHAYGHALETELEYEGLLHGEAVAQGMWLASVVAHRRGVLEQRSLRRIVGLLERCELALRIPMRARRAALERLSSIRLVRGGDLNYVLPHAIGSVEIVAEVPIEELERALCAMDEVLG